MTDIRELLRETVAALPSNDADPVRRVQQAVTRRRRNRAVVAAVCAAVIAAIAIPIRLGGGSSSTPPPVAHQHHLAREQWHSNDGDVAAGFGSIWGVKCCGNDVRPSFVERLDPATGRRLSKVTVPGPTAGISVGAGRVWALGASDAGISAISAVNPRTSRVTSIRSTRFDPDDIAFSHGSAWVTVGTLGSDEVWRLTPTRLGLHKTVIAMPGDPREIVATGNGTLWVQRDVRGIGSGRCRNCALTRIVATRTSAHLGRSVPWSGDIYTSAGPTQLWASTEGGHTFLELEPGRLGGCEACAQNDDTTVAGQAIEWIVTTPRGLFVATYGSPANTNNATNFYSNADLGSSRSAPTDRLTTDSGPLAPDGDGVVIAAEDPGLVHWIPAG